MRDPVRARPCTPWVLALVLLFLLPVDSAAQTVPGSGRGWSLGAAGGAVEYDVAGGLTGWEWGPDVSHRGDRVTVGLGYRRLEIGSGNVTPHVVRASAHARLASVTGLTVGFVAHGGGSRFVAGADRGEVTTGGAGIRVARRSGSAGPSLLPFVEVRGLFAASRGQVIGEAMDANGSSLGVETGATLVVRRMEVWVAGSMDPLASGLGVPPYATRGLRAGLGYRF